MRAGRAPGVGDLSWDDHPDPIQVALDSDDIRDWARDLATRIGAGTRAQITSFD